MQSDMKNKSVPILLLAFGFLGMPASGQEPAKDAPKIVVKPGIEGTWQLTAITLPRGGVPGFESAPAGYAEALKLTFKDGKMSMIPGEPGYTVSSYTIDSEKEPMQLNWMPTEAQDEKAKPMKAIYKIEGDKLTIMFRDDKRPTDYDRSKSYSYEGTRVIEKKKG